MRTIFLTGITGTLGSKIAELAVENGDKVIGLIRTKSTVQGPVHPSIQLVEGGLFSELSPFLYGVDIIIHAAAETRQSRIKYRAYNKINVEATALLFQTAVKCKVKQFIYVSTANTVWSKSTSVIVDKLAPMPSQFVASYYARSKYAAEKYLYYHRHLMNILIVNPTFIIGSAASLRSSNTIITRVWRKPVIFVPPGGKNFVSVTEVAESILTHQGNQSGFIKKLIAGQNLSYEDFYKKFLEVSNQRSLLIKIPYPILSLLGYFGDTLRRLRVQTSLCSMNMKLVSSYNYYPTNNIPSSAQYKTLDSAIEEIINKLKTLQS
ncbi:MAG: NAD-dependent epimerase/dehydratase family protein [Cyclobacteriaceae bacterium]|nr:NAD-dependent epimerase/dehydratase family protein [Cyclobacteriaceae bacterium]